MPAHSLFKKYGFLRWHSEGAQILGRGLARLAVGDNLERHLLSLIETMHPCALDRADVHEDIATAVILLDESEAFLAVEPLHGSLCHIAVLSDTSGMKPRASAARFGRDLGEVFSPARAHADAKSFG
jgi:hypothetical protein